MIITKSLFVEYQRHPKLAWWHVNDRETYRFIQDLEFKGAPRETLGKQVEVLALRLYDNIETCIIEEPETIEGDETWHIRYAEATGNAISSSSDKLIYQAAFLHENLFCITDFLVPDGEGRFDLVEVKSKHKIRHKSRQQKLFHSIRNDAAFQAYVLKHTLGKAFSGRTFVCYLNKDFRRTNVIDPAEILICEDISEELPKDVEIEEQLLLLQTELQLDKQAFEERYPFKGSKFPLHHGLLPDSGTIWRIPGSNVKLMEALDPGNHAIGDIDEKDLDVLVSEKILQPYQAKYIKLYKNHETYIQKETLKKRLESLKAPLVFYDYETLASPIPLLRNTGPWEQVMVQFSMHILKENPMNFDLSHPLKNYCTHREGIIESGARDNQLVVEQLIDSIASLEGDFVVWNRHFENACNRNLAKMYPQWENALYRMSHNCFDLMDIFKDLVYFDRKFKGSNSLKDILPAMTDLDYSDLEISDGGTATGQLEALIRGEISPEEQEKVRKDLLAYCKRDTLAMVLIFEALLKALQ